jgi:hypothetical protein
MFWEAISTQNLTAGRSIPIWLATVIFTPPPNAWNNVYYDVAQDKFDSIVKATNSTRIEENPRTYQVQEPGISMSSRLYKLMNTYYELVMMSNDVIKY